MLNFNDRVVLVTGGASGIGLRLTEEFLQKGARVVVWDWSQEALSALGERYGANSENLRLQKVDVGNWDSALQAKDQLSWPIHVLINNAGITQDKSFAKMEKPDWDRVINVNLTGLFNVTKVLLNSFAEGDTEKRIINISSVVGLYGNFGQSNYAAAKAGVIGLTKTWAKELGRKGFTVNAVAPGFIRTAMTEAMPKEVLNQMEQKVSVQRLGETSDIANACAFLASPLASYINGTVLSVDGGLTL